MESLTQDWSVGRRLTKRLMRRNGADACKTVIMGGHGIGGEYADEDDIDLNVEVR